MGNCTVDSLATYYSAGQGFVVIDGRLVDYYMLATIPPEVANMNDRAARHAALLEDSPGHDYDTTAIPDDIDETTGINYDSEPDDPDDMYMDPPYAEPYDGNLSDLSDDHPMVAALLGVGFWGYIGTNNDDQEVIDGWFTPAPSSSGTSEEWEPLTNTRGHDLENDAFNWDWMPDFGSDANTDSE